jgi:iron complex outermembrane receptor protein
MRKLIALCMIVFSLESFAQITITGKVLDEKSNPVSGASIYVLNTQYAAVSDKDGRFHIRNLRKGEHVLNVSSIGYASVNRPVNLEDGTGEIQIVLYPSSRQLSDVVISTQKKEELLQTVPLSITTFSSAQVESLRLWDTKELTALAPNLYTADPGDKRNVTSIRGIVSSSYDPAVATYIDGVNQFGLDTYISQLFDVERIEIARGPQGTLYGRNAMGGVMNIFTKRPENKASGFAEASIGNFGQRRMGAGIRLPVIKDRLFFGAAGLYQKRDGFYKNAFNNSNYDDQHSTSGNYYLKYIARTPWSFVLNVKHTDNRNDGAFPLVFGVDEALNNPFVLNQNATARMIDNIFNTSFSIIHSGPSLNFTSQSSYQSNYRYYKTPIDADFSPIDGISIINNYGKDWNRVRVWTQELKFSSPSKKESSLYWTAGTYLFYQNSPVKQATRFGDDAMMLGMQDQNFLLINSSTSKSKGLAVYGQATYKLAQRIDLTAGLRYDYEQKQQSISGEYQKDPDPDPMFAFRPDTSASANFKAFSPKLGLSFYPAFADLFYLTYSKGFRAGGLTPLSSDPSQPALFPFKPEVSNTVEAGLKNTFFNKRLLLNLSIFYSNVSDVQVPTLVLPDAVTITKNTGELASKGIELEARSVIGDLELDYSFGYTNATYKKLKLSQNSSEVNLQGKHQLFTPDITSMLTAQYNLYLNSKRTTKLFFRGEWRYLGRQYFDLTNTIRQSPYHTMNTSFGLAVKRFSVMFWTRNLNDATYISYAYDFGAVHLGDPRNYGATAKIAF